MKRFERKYVLSDNQLPLLNQLISLSPASFIQAHPDRIINSMYFDDAVLSVLRDNIDGNPNRNKVRLRWYGDNIDQITGAQLEIKSKHGLTGTKRIFPFPDMALTDLSGITSTVNHLLGSGHLMPTLLVQYHRAYFESFNRHIRITLDTDIIYESMNGIRYPADSIVMEIKYPPDEELLVAEWMQYFPYRIAKHSKYAQGMMQESA